MRIKEITEGFVGRNSPISGGNAVPKKKRAAQKKVEELVNEGPLWDKTKRAVAGVAIAGAAMGGAHAGTTVTTTSFNADAGTPQYEQMQELASKYYQQNLEKAKESGTVITVDMLRRMRNDAQFRAIRDLSK